ncbi:MAG: hypothetical protein Q8S21_03995 [Candidatus Paracaedibacteraceae bacterium]|nr:hypothetical protein [Candidatus Paracaedibacteraceae bacterium]
MRVTGMMAKVSFGSVVKWLLWCGWLALFIGGVANYSGSWLTYTTFSLVFLAMLLSGLYRQVSYGYLFLVVMLWLGFWLKITVHLLVDYPFGESTGLFDKSPSAWDEVLLITTMGSIGVVVARALYQRFSLVSSSMVVRLNDEKFLAPVWYLAKRRWVWAGLIIVCVGLAIINSSLGILQVGLVPRTILPWPLNAVISWLVGYGLTLGIATLLWWDIVLGKNVSLVVYFVLIEAFTSTLSLFSRGAYIFHVIPQFFSLFKNRSRVIGWSRNNIIAVSATFIVLFAISYPLVNKLRAHYYSYAPMAGEFSVLGADADADTDTGVSELNKLARFGVDRWIGAEGLMAVWAHPGKGSDLFWEGIRERREVGKDTLYIEISRAVAFRAADKTKFQFTEIPGAMAFLYYSGKLWIVALGMFVFAWAVLASEALVSKYTGNPILCALWGGMTANAVTQFGVAPRSLLITLFEMICGIAAIWFVQSEYLSRGLQKTGLTKNMKSGA